MDATQMTVLPLPALQTHKGVFHLWENARLPKLDIPPPRRRITANADTRCQIGLSSRYWRRQTKENMSKAQRSSSRW